MLFRLILRVNSHAFFFRWAAYIVVAMQGTLLVSALRHYLAPQKKSLFSDPTEGHMKRFLSCPPN